MCVVGRGPRWNVFCFFGVGQGVWKRKKTGGIVNVSIDLVS